ncbi:hypothetical protein BH11MYX2_BH11MYX2_30330 [soil metagenome]
MPGPSFTSAAAAPLRWLLRPAGVLTQIACAFSLLLGTIAFVLVATGKTSGVPFVAVWAVAAMVGLVLGGLMARGGVIAVVGGGLVNITFGIVLLAIPWETLRALLRLLPESDVTMIADILVGFAIGQLAVGVMALASIGQARRYNRALQAAEDEAEKSGIWDMGALPYVPTTIPAAGAPPPPQNGPPLMPAPLDPQPRPASASGIPSLAGAQVRQSQMPPSFGPPTGGMGASSSGAMQRQSQLPLPPPPPSRDGYVPTGLNQPSPIQLPQGYLPSGPGGPPIGPDGMPLGMEPPTSAATAPGWQPAPVQTYRTTMMIVRSPEEERKSRRRVYIALAGFAIGLGCGVGVLVSSGSSSSKRPTGATMKVASSNGSDTKSTTPSTPAKMPPDGSGSSVVIEQTPQQGQAKPPAVDTVLAAQRALIAKGDTTGLASTFSATAFAFGIDADEVAEGRDAIAPMLKHDLGDPPSGGFTVTSRFQTIGIERDHAWTAEELELSGPGIAARRIAITQLVAFVNGQWTVVAAHWGRPVADSTAERLAIMGTLPQPRQVPNRADDPALAKFVAAAFASRSAFADARSERADAFNFGSGPGERIIGGAKIKALFARLKSQLRIDGGARVVSGAAWDSAQRGGAWVGFAALNVVYTQKSRAQTDVTQTFRVLAILVKEQDRWTIVQTQFSNAGPIAE